MNRARIPIEFQLADEGMQGMCRRGADLRGPLKFIAKFGSSKVHEIFQKAVKRVEKRYSMFGFVIAIMFRVVQSVQYSTL